MLNPHSCNVLIDRDVPWKFHKRTISHFILFSVLSMEGCFALHIFNLIHPWSSTRERQGCHITSSRFLAWKFISPTRIHVVPCCVPQHDFFSASSTAYNALAGNSSRLFSIHKLVCFFYSIHCACSLHLLGAVLVFVRVCMCMCVKTARPLMKIAIN